MMKYLIDQMDEWGESEWLSHFNRRLVLMKSRRDGLMKEIWDDADNSVTSVSFYDERGVLQVVVPLEKILTEIYIGRTEGKINFDVLPDGQASREELYPAKYALQFFLDGNNAENFWKEDKLIREYKSKGGSSFWYTGIRCVKDYRYEAKDDIYEGYDILDKKNLKRVEHEQWYFHPKAIHYRDLYIDDAACGQRDIQNARDVIMKERVSKLELENRYKGLKQFNIKDINFFVDEDARNKNDYSIENDQIVLYHYFDRITKKYLIVANKNKLIYEGYYLYDDGKLPFVNTQHFSREDRMWGEGFSERAGWLKAYKSELWNDMLNAAAMGSGMQLVVGNGEDISEDWQVGGRQVNIWRTTGGVEKIQQLNMQPNMSQTVNILQLLEQEIAMVTGVNPREQFEPMSDKVGIVEIMEANKSVRNRSIDENYNIALDEALTMTFSRIRQFAPTLLSKTIKDSEGNPIKKIFPMIRVSDMSVSKKKSGYEFIEDIGKYGYFELRPEVVQGVGVKITTPSTNYNLPILERQKVTEYIQNISMLANVAQADMTGEAMQKLKSYVKFDDLLDWMSDAYGYDIDGLRQKSGKDEIRKRNIEMMEQFEQLLSINDNENAEYSSNEASPANEQRTPAGPIAGNGTPTGGNLSTLGGEGSNPSGPTGL